VPTRQKVHLPQDWAWVKQQEISRLRQSLGLGPIAASGMLPVDNRPRYAVIDPVAAAIAASQQFAETVE